MNEERKNDTCRKSSTREWASVGTNQDINSGSFQRMADALEQTNKSNQELINKLIQMQDFYLRKLNSMNEKLSNMKGRITKLEKKW